MKTFKYILVFLDIIGFIMLIPTVMVLFFETDWSSLNLPAIRFIVLFTLILIVANVIFVSAFNIRKFENQEHLRLVVDRYNNASNKLNEAATKLSNDIRKEILDDVVKNTN